MLLRKPAFRNNNPLERTRQDRQDQVTVTEPQIKTPIDLFSGHFTATENLEFLSRKNHLHSNTSNSYQYMTGKAHSRIELATSFNFLSGESSSSEEEEEDSQEDASEDDEDVEDELLCRLFDFLFLVFFSLRFLLLSSLFCFLSVA